MPAAGWLTEFLRHLGFDVKAKWYVPGEFHTKNILHCNTGGRLGAIWGCPRARDLAGIEETAVSLIREPRLILGVTSDDSRANAFRLEKDRRKVY